MNNIEELRKKWDRGETCIGTLVGFKDATISELLGEAGFDFVWIDCEHSAMGPTNALEHVRAARGAMASSFIRVPSSDPGIATQYLELHPAGIIVPHINNAEDAEYALKALRYPPDGNRGYGPTRGMRFGGITQKEYIERVDNEMMIILQIEHINAANQIDEILEMPGVGSIVTGPNDLSGTMGLFGQTSHPKVVTAIKKVYSAAIEKGIPTGHSMGYNPEEIKRWLAMGLSWISVESDWTLLFKHASSLAKELRGIQT